MKVNNILFIERKLNPTGGGVQRVTYVLGEKFREKGYSVWYAFYTKETDSDKIPINQKLLYDITDNTDLLYYKFKKYIVTNKIDTIIVQNVYFKKFLAIYKRLKVELSINIISCLHENPDKSINKNKYGLVFNDIYIKDLLRIIKRKLFGDQFIKEMNDVYKISDKYVLLSEKYIPVWKTVMKSEDIKKLVGINNPCTINCKTNKSKENILLVVARMEESQKRISNVLKIWNNIYNEYNNWKLVIVGGGPDYDRYRKYSKKRHIKNVYFEGPSDNVENYYEKSEIFLMTSIWEGFPLTLLESQYFGCVPVVFDNYAAIHDIISGNNGIIVPSNRLDLFQQSLRKLMDNPQLWNEMSINAVSSINDNFKVEKIFYKWKMLFEDLEK